MIEQLKKVMVLALTLCLLIPMSVYAAPSFNVTPSASSVAPNGTFTVAVGGQCVGRVNISASNGSVSPSSVWLDNSSAKITVKAGASGTVTVTATPAEGMSDLDANLYSPGPRSVSVSIKAPSQPKPTPAPTPKPTAPVVPEVDPMDDAIEVAVGSEELYLWPKLVGVKIPEGFEKGESKYKEGSIEVATKEPLTLAYLTDEEGKNGAFWNYEEKDQSFYPYVKIATQSTYIFLQPEEDVVVPEGYEETSVTIDEQTLKGWAIDDPELKDFVLLYALNSEAEEGFYLYDMVEGTMQRYGERIVEVEVEVEVEPEPQTITQQIFGNPILAGIFSGLGLLAAGLAAALIRVIQKNKRNLQ